MIFYINKNTNKKLGMCKNWLGRVRNTKSLNLCYCKGRVLIWYDLKQDGIVVWSRWGNRNRITKISAKL